MENMHFHIVQTGSFLGQLFSHLGDSTNLLPYMRNVTGAQVRSNNQPPHPSPGFIFLHEFPSFFLNGLFKLYQ